MDEDFLKPPDPPDIWDEPLSSNVFMNSSSDTVQSSSSAVKRRFDGRVDQGSGSRNKKTISNIELASASIQGLYCSSSLVIGFKAYTSTDKGPFIVHASRTEPDPSAGLTIRPIKFGQFLVQNKVDNICPGGVKKVGRNKISIEFRSYVDANTFLDNPILSSHNYEVTIPTYNVTKMGIVRYVPVDLSMGEFATSLIVPVGCGEVLKARRLNRKTKDNDGNVTWVPTQTVVLTFHGQVLPSRVFSFHTSMAVEAYQYPTIQCLKCCRFGHIKAQCRSNPRCFKCAQSHPGESCEVNENTATCLHCSGQHFASSKNCPEQGRQRSIKLLMSQESISYEDASKQCPRANRSYAEVAQISSQPLITQFSSSSNTKPSSYIPPVSHRKTIFVPAVSHKRAFLGKAYDHQAHQAIVGNIPSCLPNGCALSNENEVSQETSLVETLITLIINILSQNKTHLPPNVAHQLMQIITLTNNYGSNIDSAMEQSEYTQQKN